MGNWNLNGWTQYRRRGVVEDTLAFSVTALRQLRLTDQLQYAGAFRWDLAVGECRLQFNTRPNYEAGLWLTLESLQFSGQPDESGDPIILDQQISMHATPLPHGGARWWLECPIIKEYVAGIPQPCSRRCALVYYSPKLRKFGCRKCLQLTYRTRQQHNKSADIINNDPEAFRQAVLQLQDKLNSDEARLEEVRKQRLMSSAGLLPKGPKKSGGSGGAPAGM